MYKNATRYAQFRKEQTGREPSHIDSPPDRLLKKKAARVVIVRIPTPLKRHLNCPICNRRVRSTKVMVTAHMRDYHDRPARIEIVRSDEGIITISEGATHPRSLKRRKRPHGARPQ